MMAPQYAPAPVAYQDPSMVMAANQMAAQNQMMAQQMAANQMMNQQMMNVSSIF
jgi:hypothetical protein